MIYLDDRADTLPAGLFGTPFEAVYRALRTVAADVWAVDPTVYRAGMAWGWYALYKPEKLVGFRDVVTAALISAFAPMIKDTQTDAELVEYLRQWREYVPTFGRLQALYALFGAVVDIQPITDPESQAVIPVEDTRLAFYVRITEVDFARPLSLADAREIALRATPLGSRPYVYYALESRTQVPVAAIQQPGEVFVENWEIAQPAAPPVPVGEFILVDSFGNVVYSVEHIDEVVFAEAGYFTIDSTDDVVFVEQSPFPVVCTYTASATPQSIAPDASFDTGLQYYSSKLYIGETNDGQGNVTRYGWEAEEGTLAPAYIDVLLGLRYDPGNRDWKTVAFDQTPLSSENYWWACVLNQADADVLQAFGVTYHDPSSIWGGTQFTGPIGNVVYDSDYSYEFLALYSDMGETEAAQDIWSAITLDYLVRDNHGLLVIWDKTINSSVPVKTWKCRITRNS